MTGPTAVLAMAYGSPEGPSDIETFYTDVRRGRPPTSEQLAELTRRYDAIGGTSPLRERTTAQIASIQHALDAASPGEFTVFYAAKHARPKIERAIDEIAEQGFASVVGLVLAPHYSALSVGEYLERAASQAKLRRLPHRFIRHWGAERALIELLSERLEEALTAIGEKSTNPEVLFSAHSLPARIVSMADPYPDELAETARLVASRCSLPHYRTTWQSAGRTPEPWLGPDLLEVLGSLASEAFDGAVVVPAGFTSDHLEVLFDLDIEARARATSLGIAFSRTRSLNDDPRLGALLARLVLEAREAESITA